MLSHMDLFLFYKVQFSLIQHHKYSKADLDDMFPYERDIFHTLLVDHLQEVEQKRLEQSKG